MLENGKPVRRSAVSFCIAASIIAALLTLAAGSVTGQTNGGRPTPTQTPSRKPTPGPRSARTGSATGGATAASWRFVVGGDSRNCGDIVMPSVAAGSAAQGAAFYWHLGDFRAIYDFDQDFLQQTERRGKKVSISDYQRTAWDDFIESQLIPFGTIPVFLGIGNHELVAPKTRPELLNQFADWFNAEPIRRQRLQDDPKDHRLKTWYHWIQGGIDFVNLDNASSDQFEADQARWFEGVVTRAEANPEIRAIVVGMHAALPDSLAAGHSMNDWAQGEQSGRRVYARLLQVRKKKPVYLFASHSHFYMRGIFGTREKKASAEVLPGWIAGTGGAFRYALPAVASEAAEARTNVYGYLVVTVAAPGAAPGEIRAEFHEIRESDVPASILSRYGADTVHECFVGNTASPALPALSAPAASASPALRH